MDNTNYGSGVTENPFMDNRTIREFYDIRQAHTLTAVVVGVFIFVLMFVGVILNSWTIYAILKTREYKNAFSCFLLSLCISDLLSAVVSPLFWYRRTLGFDVWRIAPFLCKLYWGMDMSTSCATTLHILACTIVRYIGIKYPLSYKKITKRHAAYTTLAVWTVAVLFVFVPFAYFNEAVIRPRGTDEPDAMWAACSDTVENHSTNAIYILIAVPILLYIPMLLTTILYFVIVCTVKRKFRQFSEVSEEGQSRRHRKEERALRQLMFVILSFAVGYIPAAVYAVWTRTHKRYSEAYEVYDYWMLILSYILLRMSECMDPVVYTLGSITLKNFSKQALRKVFPCCKKMFPHKESYENYKLKYPSNFSTRSVSTPLKMSTAKPTYAGNTNGNNRHSELLIREQKTL